MPSWSWLWHAEIEKFPSAVMAVRHPQSVNLGDVTANDFCDRALAIGCPDVLIFGSPCQSFSVAGKRLGLDDPRGNLALVALGIVDRLRRHGLRWFVFENVPGLLSSASGRDFGLFLRTVDELGAALAWTVLDAQYRRVAQRRRRVFAVGCFGDWRGPASVLFESESVRGHSAPRREAGKDVAGTFGARATSGGGFGTDFETDGGLVPTVGTMTNQHSVNEYHGQLVPERAHLIPEIAPTLNAGGNKTGGNRQPGMSVDTADSLIVSHAIQAGALRENTSSGPDGVGVQEELAYTLEARAEVQAVSHALRGDGFDASEDGSGRGAPLVPVVASTLTNNHGGGGFGSDQFETFVPMYFQGRGSNLDLGQQVAGTIGENCDRASGGAPLRGREGGGTAELGDEISNAARASQGGGDKPHVLTEMAVRRLMPVECERLQGFPDHFTAITYRKKPAKDAPQVPFRFLQSASVRQIQ